MNVDTGEFRALAAENDRLRRYVDALIRAAAVLRGPLPAPPAPVLRLIRAG